MICDYYIVCEYLFNKTVRGHTSLMYELNESKVKSDVSDDESRSYPAFKFAVLFLFTCNIIT